MRYFGSLVLAAAAMVSVLSGSTTVTASDFGSIQKTITPQNSNTTTAGAASIALTCVGKNNQVLPELREIVDNPYCCSAGSASQPAVINPAALNTCLRSKAAIIERINQLMLSIRSEVETAGICNFGATGDPGVCPSSPQASNPTEELQQAFDEVDCEVNAFNIRYKAIQANADQLKQFAQAHCGN